MPLLKTLLFVVLLATAAVAQNPPSSAPAAPPDPHNPSAMHAKHLQEMQQNVKEMRANLDQLKALAPKLEDPLARQVSQLNITLWEAMIKHMEDMLQGMTQHDAMMGMMMQAHPGMRQGGCCADGKCSQGTDKPAASPANSL